MGTSFWVLHSVYVTVGTSHWILHSRHFTVGTSQWVLHCAYFTVCTSQWVLHSGHFTVDTSQWVLHSEYFTAGTSHEGLCTYVVTRCLILFMIRNVFDKVLEKIKTHFLCSTFFSPRKSAVYEIMWKNIVQPDRQVTDDSMIWRMRFVCWINKATVAHSNCEIITASPR
jgi:hypothetical protein